MIRYWVLQNDVDYAMSDHKRKRSTCEGDTTKLAGVNDVPYFVGLPEGVAELADVVLLVEGHELPVHSFILIRKSPVLLTAVTTASKPSQRVCQVPLSDETKEAVVTVLRYLYQETLQIDSSSDAQILAKFAHKYNMTQTLELCEKYFVGRLPNMLSVSAVFGWAKFAEAYYMSTLLAHCEQYIALNYRTMSVEHKQLSKLSHNSLRRIMDCLARRSATSGEIQPYMLQNSLATTSNLDLCPYCCCVGKGSGRCPCLNGRSFTSHPHLVKGITHGALDAFADAAVPSVDLLIQWQQA